MHIMLKIVVETRCLDRLRSFDIPPLTARQRVRPRRVKKAPMSTSCTMMPAIMIWVPGSVLPIGDLWKAFDAKPPPTPRTMSDMMSQLMKTIR
jgi:hypothetical protein